MLFVKTGRPAVGLLRIAMLAGLLPLGGCSDSTATSSTTYDSGDKRNDPALKASMEKSIEVFKAKKPAIKGHPVAAKRPR